MTGLPCGYQDGTRISQQDGLNPVYSLDGTYNTQQDSGPFPTQGYSHTLVWIQLGAGTLRLDSTSWVDSPPVTWFPSLATAVDSLITGDWIGAIPNLGPYQEILFVPAFAPFSFTGKAVCLLSNKPRPRFFFPGRTYWKPLTQNIAASGSLTLYPPYYWSGPTYWRVNGGATAMTFQLQQEDIGGTWTTFADTAPAAAGIVNLTNVLWPLAPVRLLITNTSATTANNTWGVSSVPDLEAL
jgi:hypothetical protein